MLKSLLVPIKFAAIVAALAGVCAPSIAEDGLSAQAQAQLDATLAKAGLAGMTAGIAMGGEIVWTGAAGYSDLENKVAAIPDMVHRIASISKPMTAVAAMQLVERGQMKLDDPLRKFVPEWPESPMGEIQILHLLTHTSGIKHYAGDATRTYTQYNTLTDAVAFIMNRRSGIALPPQERYIYTTYGYTVLSLVIERASGRRFAEYMRESVWLPAGMQNTSLEVKGESVPNKSKLYRLGADGKIEDDDYDDLSAKAGGGGIQSTAADLLRFAIAFEDEKLLTRESMDQMLILPPLTNPRGEQREQYGSGWGFGDSPSLGKILSHSGGQSGTSTFLLICRDHEVAVSVLSNTAETGAPYDLAYSLARLAAGVPAPEPAAN